MGGRQAQRFWLFAACGNCNQSANNTRDCVFCISVFLSFCISVFLYFRISFLYFVISVCLYFLLFWSVASSKQSISRQHSGLATAWHQSGSFCAFLVFLCFFIFLFVFFGYVALFVFYAFSIIIFWFWFVARGKQSVKWQYSWLATAWIWDFSFLGVLCLFLVLCLVLQCVSSFDSSGFYVWCLRGAISQPATLWICIDQPQRVFKLASIKLN